MLLIRVGEPRLCCVDEEALLAWGTIFRPS